MSHLGGLVDEPAYLRQGASFEVSRELVDRIHVDRDQLRLEDGGDAPGEDDRVARSPASVHTRDRAGVGVGTVYRHFPSLDELIPACGEVTKKVLALPDPQRAFDGLEAPAERIARLVQEAFAIYVRGAPQLRAIRNEPDVHPNVAEAGDQVEASLAALIEAAFEPIGIASPDRAVVRAMIDLGTWDALREQQVGDPEAVIVEMLVARIATG